jgi:hypothetical protein
MTMETVYPIARTAWVGSRNTLYIVVCPDCGQEHKHLPTSAKKKAPCGASYTVDTNVSVPFRAAPKKGDATLQARYDELMAAQRDRDDRDRWEFWLGFDTDGHP